MAEGHPVKWVFDGSKLDWATVKRRVLEAMREPGFRGKVDDILEKEVARGELKNLLEREVENSKQLIESLKSDQVFDIIFCCDMGALPLDCKSWMRPIALGWS